MSYFTLLKIWDGTNGPAAVKAASTAAVAADPALVVAVSPNNNVSTLPGLSTSTLTAWTPSNWTGGFSAVLVSASGCQAAIVQLDQNASITAGAVTWQGTYDGTNWVTIPADQVLDPTSSTFAQLSNPYTFLVSTAGKVPFLILMGGYQSIRALESTPMTGAGASITPFVTQLAYSPVTAITPASIVVTQSTAANLKAQVVGNLTTNNAAPTGNNVGVLPAVANAAVPTLTEGDQVLVSSDLQGSQRTRPGSPISGNWTVAPISFSSSGNNVVIAGVGGKTIKVMRMFFVNGGATGITSTSITFQDNAGSPTIFTGAFQLVTAGVYINKGDGEPYYTCATSAGFVINSSQAVAIAGAIWYVVS